MTEEQLNKLNDTDLEHYANGEMDKMSDAGLEVLAAGPGAAPQPNGNDQGGPPNFLDVLKGFSSGALNEASLNYIPKDVFKNESPTATNLGRVIGGLLSGAGVGKAASKIPGLAKLMYSGNAAKQAAARVAANAGLSGAIGAARNPHEGETRGGNALNDAMFGTGLSVTGETLQTIPPLARFLGRTMSGLSRAEADAFRASPGSAELLFRGMDEGGSDKISDGLSRMFRGSKETGETGLQSILQSKVIDPAKAAKAAELQGVVGNLELDSSQAMGLSPEVQGLLPTMNIQNPRKIVLSPDQASKVQTAAAKSAYDRARAARVNPIAYPHDPMKDVDLALANDLRSKMEVAAPGIKPYNRTMENAINYKDKVDDLGNDLTTLIRSDGNQDLIRSYYDRNTGSSLNQMANQYEAGKKLYGNRQASLMNIPSLLAAVGGQPVSRALIRTPKLPPGVTGLSALQAILRGTEGLSD